MMRSRLWITIGLCLLMSVSALAEPLIGAITTGNSVTGSNANDEIGSHGVYELPSGNVVIVSPNWNGNRGAVTCLSRAEVMAGGVVVTETNSLTGANAGHWIGIGGIVVLPNGNYVVSSPEFDDDTNGTNAGAYTLVNGITCYPAGESARGVVVSATNSLIGQATDEDEGFDITPLSDGDYVLHYDLFSYDSLTAAGFALWCNGFNGCVGRTIDETNALVGSSSDDGVGLDILALPNGNYVVLSPDWDGGKGAATFGNGLTGTAGFISAANSLVGGTAGDEVGGRGVVLTDGDYVVSAPFWDDGATINVGAVTRCDGTTGCMGTLSAANAMIGDTANDRVGYNGVTVLTNGDYVVSSQYWSNDAGTPNVGAVTLCDSSAGCPAVVSESNSLIGDSDGDFVGSGGATALSNGRYIANNFSWDDGGITNAGASTWCNADVGCAGMVVSAANSVVGGAAFDLVGINVTVLSNGNYVISSSDWDNQTTSVVNAGFAMWCDAATGCTTGTISASNALVGTQTGQQVSNFPVIALTNGNFVVISGNWSDGTYSGAVTWGDGVNGTVGAVTAANSIVDFRGSTTVTALTNGNYVASSPLWDNDTLNDVGAVVWANGSEPSAFVVGPSNALIGATSGDFVGTIHPLPNGDYVVTSQQWDNGVLNAAGAATYGDGDAGVIGAVDSANSLVGTTAQDLIGQSVLGLTGGGYLVSSPLWNSDTLVDVGAVTYSPDADALQNLLTNASFETAGATAKQASGWTLKNPKSADRRLCSTVAKPITVPDDECVFQFSVNNTPDKARSLKQVLTGGDLGGAGQTLTLSAFVEGNKLKSGGKIVVTVTYADNTTAKFNVPFGSGTFAFVEKTGSLNLTKTVTKIVVNLNMAKVTGRVRVDDLWLTLSDTTRLPFPSTTRAGAMSDIPTPPDGFRK